MRKGILAVFVCVLAAAALLAQGSGETKKMAPKKMAAAKAVTLSPADLKWVDLSSDAPGVKIVDLWGDHTKGAYGALTKFPAGWSTPLHTHTFDMRIVVMSGTLIHTPEGKAEVRLGPGSYLFQPGGNYRHTTACDKASECEIFVESKGKFDIKPVEEGKAPEKK